MTRAALADLIARAAIRAASEAAFGGFVLPPAEVVAWRRDRSFECWHGLVMFARGYLGCMEDGQREFDEFMTSVGERKVEGNHFMSTRIPADYSIGEVLNRDA